MFHLFWDWSTKKDDGGHVGLIELFDSWLDTGSIGINKSVCKNC